MKTVAEVVFAKWFESLTDEDRARMEEVARRACGFIIKVKEAVDAAVDAGVQATTRAIRDHERAGLLRLYRQRHSWKTADLPRLNTYRLNKAAHRRVAALKKSSRLGRGSTLAYQSLFQQLAEAGQYFAALHDPNTPGHQRVRMLKCHKSWWPQFIEMTYRGEYERLKRLGGTAPHEEAERAVAKAFYISPSSVKRNCVLVRKDHTSVDLVSDSMTVAEFEMWKQSGQLPDVRRDSSSGIEEPRHAP